MQPLLLRRVEPGRRDRSDSLALTGPLFFGPLSSGWPKALWGALRQSDPRLALRVVTAIYAAEDAAVRGELRAEHGDQLRSRLPLLEGEGDVEDLTEAYLRYASFSRLTRTLVFLLADRDPDLIRVTGLEAVEDCRRAGTPVVLVPFHVRHHDALLGAVAGLGLPLTILAAPSLATWMDHHYPARNVDVQFIPSMAPTVLYLCRRAVRSERVLVWFPDHYTGRSQPDLRVEFLGTTIGTSSHLPTFCRRERAVTVPCYLRASDAPSGDIPLLEVTFGKPRRHDSDDGAAYLQDLSDFYADSLRNGGDEIEWLGWERGDMDPGR